MHLHRFISDVEVRFAREKRAIGWRECPIEFEVPAAIAEFNLQPVRLVCVLAFWTINLEKFKSQTRV